MLSPQLCQKPRGWDYIVAPVPPLSNWPNQMMKEVGSQISPRPKLDIEWLVIWGSKEIWLRHSNFLVSLFNELATLKDLPFRDYMCLNSRRQKVIALISFYFPPSELYGNDSIMLIFILFIFSTFHGCWNRHLTNSCGRKRGAKEWTNKWRGEKKAILWHNLKYS